MTGNAAEFRQKIVDFPFIAGCKNDVGAKIKVIAYLAETKELARRGVYASDASKQAEILLSGLAEFDINQIPANIQDALAVIECPQTALEDPDVTKDFEEKIEYITMFDFIQQEISLNLERISNVEMASKLV